MSMTVHIAMRGITDLEILLEALREMRIKAHATNTTATKQPPKIVAFADLCGRRVGFARDASGGIAMVGDNEWRAMNDQRLQQKIRQHYSLVAVKRKISELHYNLAEVENMEDGSIRLVARAWR